MGEVKTTTTIITEGDIVKVTVKADNFDINKKYLLWNLSWGGNSFTLGSQYLQRSGVLGFNGKLLGFFNKLLGDAYGSQKSPSIKMAEPTEIDLHVDNDVSLYKVLGVRFLSGYSGISLNGGPYNKVTEEFLRNTYLTKGIVNKIKLI